VTPRVLEGEHGGRIDALGKPEQVDAAVLKLLR